MYSVPGYGLVAQMVRGEMELRSVSVSLRMASIMYSLMNLRRSQPF
jgi:hypothetical protein